MSLNLTNKMYSFPLDSSTITIGRDNSNDVIVRGVGVSKSHARIKLYPENPHIYDVKSSFGVRVDQKVVSDSILEHGTVIAIGVIEFEIAIEDLTLYLIERSDYIEPKQTLEIQKADSITIGRDADNVINLSHPLISRFHCTVYRDNNGNFSMEDHGSMNGTYVNGVNLNKAKLEDGDIVQICPFRFILDNGKFIKADDSKKIKLEAFGLRVSLGGKKIINDISLIIQPGEFVGILGPSGAGKSTLAKALTGQIELDSGYIYYNGFPLSQFSAAFSSTVGYVSQNNLLRPELTVWETLVEQAILRLPNDSNESERVDRIKDVMEMLDIQSLRDSRISNLSGGEAKRVHLGIELLSAPTIIFMDEPLSGLDPGLIHKFMILFKKLCKKGHTVLLTTHTLEQIELCSRLFFISNGKLVYQGTPEDTTEAMRVTSIAEVYEKVRMTGNVRESTVIQAIPSSDEEKKLKNLSVSRVKLRRPKTAGFTKQFFMLFSRYSKVMFRDRANLALIILQAPLIALLLALVFNGESKYLPLPFYFCVTISAIWIGGVNSAREIAREWELYYREFRAGLSSVAYICSKISVFSILALLQAVLFTASLDLFFNAFEINQRTLLLVSATTISGTILGLCISAFSGNVNRAVSLLPIVYIPQIFFSGILIPFDRMPELGRIISNITVSRHTFSMFKKVCLVEQSVYGLSEWLVLILLNVVFVLLIGIRVRWFRLFTRTYQK